MTDFEKGAEAMRELAVKIATDGGCDCHFAPCPHDDAGKAIAHRIRSATLNLNEQQPPGSESREALERAADALMEAARALARADGMLALDGRLSDAAATQNASDAARAAAKAVRRAIAPDARPATENGWCDTGHAAGPHEEIPSCLNWTPDGSRQPDARPEEKK